MAQTIAVQRGTTTVTGNGTTKVTLFTQSSGTATRVILCGVSANTAAGTGINFSLGLHLNVSSGGNYLPIAIVKGIQSGARYTAMFPGGTSTSQGEMWGGATSGEGLIPGSSTYMSTTDGGLPADLNSGTMHLTGNVAYQYIYTALNYVPTQFWMANGDSLAVSHYNSSGNTATIIYHFVTITES